MLANGSEVAEKIFYKLTHYFLIKASSASLVNVKNAVFNDEFSR